MLPSGTSMGKQCAWIWESPKAVPFRQEKVQPVPRVRAVPHVPEIVKINVSRVLGNQSVEYAKWEILTASRACPCSNSNPPLRPNKESVSLVYRDVWTTVTSFGKTVRRDLAKRAIRT